MIGGNPTQGFESNSRRHTSVRKASPWFTSRVLSLSIRRKYLVPFRRAICMFPRFLPNRTMLPFFDKASAINAVAPAGVGARWNCLTPDVRMKSKMTCPEACGAGGNATPDDRFAPTEVANLFEHPVGAAEQRRGDIDAVRFSDA